jgi:hypothetical protein
MSFVFSSPPFLRGVGGDLLLKTQKKAIASQISIREQAIASQLKLKRCANPADSPTFFRL